MWEINYRVTRLVSHHQGTLPVILSCPHDGNKSPEGVPKRTGEEISWSCPHFKTGPRPSHPRDHDGRCPTPAGCLRRGALRRGR